LVVIAWWLLLLDDEFRLLGKDVAAGAAFVMNFTEWLRPDAHVNLPRIVAHLWSLGVEEQFYLLWPLFLATTWRWAPRHVLHFVLLVATLSFCLDIAVAQQRPWATLALPWTRVWQLSLGCALAYVDMARTHRMGATRSRV